MTKMITLPTQNRAGVLQRIRPAARVAIQAKTCIPAGTLTAMLAAEKKLTDKVGRPVVNMWCAQTPKLMKAVAKSASTTARYPTRGVRAMVGIIMLISPAAGRKMM